MILGVGMDLVKRQRIVDAIERHGERFKKRIFTEGERTYSDKKPHAPLHYAGMWAVKESLVKALGTGFRDGIAWRDIEVGHDPMGKPEVTLSGKALERAEFLGVVRVHCSITHDTDWSAAQVVLEGRHP
ncbi:MAG: holo-ACP synthase [Nitrospirota bacterium]|nr:holo-ACP synthase [Nitrospirota bacterium]